MSCVAIIPARGGSVRIPRKNIREFHGKPMLAHAIGTARQADIFDDIVVSTDDDEIGAVASMYGARWIRRSSAMAADDVGTQEVVADALWYLEDAKRDSMRFVEPYRDVCCIYPCSPMLSAETLIAAHALLVTTGDDYVVPVASWLRDPGQFYFGTARAFRERVPLIGVGTRIIAIDPETECDINTVADWGRAERMYEQWVTRRGT